MTSGQDLSPRRPRWTAAFVPLLALMLTLPLFLRGPSCGHDFGFHMQSWMDAGEQMRQGTLLPRWAASPAFNAGEPRFMFYPPASWLLGSLLLLVFPANVVPALFTLVALTLAGWGMLALARAVTSAGGALIASVLYLANPYLLFTAFERTAYAELLAAAWMPWLLRAALAEEVSALAVAVPLALLWLTNAPAAVMGTYALCLVLLFRLVRRTRGQIERGRGFLGLDTRMASAGAGGLTLGLGLAGFYLVPAAYERRYVQIAMAIIPNMRVEDNFLFGHTGYGPHDQVLHTASLVAVTLLGLTAVALGAASVRRGAQDAGQQGKRREVLLSLTVLALIIAVLLTHGSLPVWHLLPEMAFLQFPWRLLAVLGCVFALAVALALGSVRVRPGIVAVAALALAAVCGQVAIRPFREACEAHELPAERVALYAAHHGVGPTDEYTPGDADNDQLRWDDPAWWLADTPNAPGPGTVANPAATIVNYDEPPPLDQTVSGRAPRHLAVHLDRAQDLVLNLRDYPAWKIAVNGQPAVRLERDDGLVALRLPAGEDTVDVRWQTLPDVWAGEAVSVLSLGIGMLLLLRSRRIRVQE